MRNPSSTGTNKKKSGDGNVISTTKRTNSSGGTTVTPCCSKVGLKRGPWTPEEDEVLAEYIRKEGEGRWRTLPKRAGLLRCGKSCRLRWMNYLRPSVKRGQIAPDEADLILRLHRLLGNRWSLIAGRIPGRTDNEIKNYWNTHLSKKLISQGIDPRTHKPLNPPPSSSSSTPPPSKPPPPPPPPPMIANHQTPFKSSAPQTVNHDFDPSNDDIHLGQYQYQIQAHQEAANMVVTNDACDNFNDVSAMDHLLNVNNNNNNRDFDDTSYCCDDDVFTSFLDSLINEDAFAAQRHSTGHDHIASDDPLISSASPGYGSLGGVLWESPLMSATINQNNDSNPTERVVDHHE